MDKVRKNAGLVAASVSAMIMGACVSSLDVCSAVCCATPSAFHRCVIPHSQHYPSSNLTYGMVVRR